MICVIDSIWAQWRQLGAPLQSTLDEQFVTECLPVLKRIKAVASMPGKAFEAVRWHFVESGSKATPKKILQLAFTSTGIRDASGAVDDHLTSMRLMRKTVSSHISA